MLEKIQIGFAVFAGFAFLLYGFVVLPLQTLHESTQKNAAPKWQTFQILLWPIGGYFYSLFYSDQMLRRGLSALYLLLFFVGVPSLFYGFHLYLSNHPEIIDKIADLILKLLNVGSDGSP